MEKTLIKEIRLAKKHVCNCKNGCAVGGVCCGSGKCGKAPSKEEAAPNKPIAQIIDLRPTQLTS